MSHFFKSTFVFLFLAQAFAENPQWSAGKTAIDKMAGCYLVDYSYVETESLKSGYERDNRVYDVNKKNSIKEWIYPDHASGNQLRLQHILFATNPNGAVIEDAFLKHQAEDWDFDAGFLYDFVAPLNWIVKDLSNQQNQWTRRITNLDDGPRYQCAAAWSMDSEYANWSCGNFSPIPGRETREMKRKDYNTLQRNTRIVVYQNNWLERQENIKTIFNVKTGEKTSLAKELGKNWYVRLPESECSKAKQFADPKKKFWTLLKETWAEVFAAKEKFAEVLPAGQPPRFVKMMKVEDDFSNQNLDLKEIRISAKAAILKTINEYRDTSIR